MTVVLIGVMGGLAALFVVMGLRKPSSAVIRDRLETIAPAMQNKPQVRALEEIELSKPFQERIVKPLLASMARVTRRISPGTTLEKTEQRLTQAGNPRGMNVEGFYGLKGVLAIMFVVLLGLLMYLDVAPGLLPYPPQNPAQAIEFCAAALVAGFFFPDLWIRDERKRRQKRIQKALPDTIDIIAISVEAGLGFDAAVQRVGSKIKGDLSMEFERYLLELRVGKAKREALRNIIWRTGVADLSQFITAIIQADQLGVSITNVLRIQSEQMRTRRRQRAEELAHKAPIKMLFPMAFCIFPAIFVVILGPVIPTIMNGLGGK